MPRDNEPGMPSSRNNGKAKQGARSRYHQQGPGDTALWDTVDAGILLAAVHAVTAAGDAIVLARSGDGGVLSITVCSGNERIKWYPQDGARATDDLAEICRQAGGTPDAL